MKVRLGALEVYAIVAASALIWLPLLVGSVRGQESDTENFVILGLVIAFLNLCVIAFQSYISETQTELMEGQLRATETAANAALAGLDRPWLVVEGLRHNQKDWSDCNNPLVAEFRIANYGKAPALIKGLRIAHFRGLHHHVAWPSSKEPDSVTRFPGVDSFEQFLYKQTQPAMREVFRSSEEITVIKEKPGDRCFLSVGGEFSFAIAGGEKSETFCALGYKKLPSFPESVNVLTVTDGYLIGSIYYEFPGNQAEYLRFCYKANDIGGFQIHLDYAPYNETRKAQQT